MGSRVEDYGTRVNGPPDSRGRSSVLVQSHQHVVSFANTALQDELR